jgi:hypothetical protein
MTALDMSSPETVASVAARPVVLGHLVQHAVRRDLERLDRVLGEPITAVRRIALIRHTGFLLDQLQAQVALIDNHSRAAAGAADSELASRWDLAKQSRDELAGVEITLRGCLSRWRTVPGERAAVHTALREFAAAAQPVLDLDAELLSEFSTMPMPDRGIGSTAAAGLLAARMTPTKRAHLLFWLLDDHDPAQAAHLLQGTRRSTLWVLRNGFSGAYNRSAFLMWTGGGTGPAV